MCSRYELNVRSGKVTIRIVHPGGTQVISVHAKPEVFPTNLAPVLRLDEGVAVERPMQWGFLPAWLYDKRDGHTVLKKGARPIINARTDKLDGRTWSRPFQERRCLVPATGFFEFTDPAPGQKRKTRVRISLEGAPVYCFAGLWEAAPEQDRYTIITAAANARVAPVHDRMPVALREDQYGTWLDPEADIGALKDLLSTSDPPWHLEPDKPPAGETLDLFGNL